AVVAATLLLSSISVAAVNTQSIINQTEGQWLSHGRDYQETRFSPLKQVNTSNVDKLGLAWFLDYDIGRGFESTPIFYEGVLYTTAARGVVLAVDAKTGQLLWKYESAVSGKIDRKGCCDTANRGVAIYGDKVYVGTYDGRLVALNAKSGDVAWQVQTTDVDKDYTITGAPRIIDGKVIIGNGGAEMGAVRGYITAYDSETGKQLWRFYTIPGDPSKPFENKAMEQAAKTWTGEWWKNGGGGTVWDSMAFDPNLNLLYIGVGNGQPHNQLYRSPEGGDNLYLSSIVAINPDNGEMVWHYQEVPGETWDFTATQHLILADLMIDGKRRQVIMHAPKNGFFFVLDRKTGALISAEKYAYVNWAFSYDMKTGRPIEVPEARYYKGHRAMLVPSVMGAHNWQPMSFSPETGLVYIPTLHIPIPLMNDEPPYVNKPGRYNLGLSFGDDPTPPFALRKNIIYGGLLAWDPVKQRKVWSHRFDSAWNGGVLSTAGDLVFQGNGMGYFVAYNAKSGKKLWQFDAQTGIVAAPMTFEMDGVQYVTLMAGWMGAGAIGGAIFGPEHPRNTPRMLTFKLGGSVSLPPEKITPLVAVKPPEIKATTQEITEGRRLFNRYCFACHGSSATGGGEVKDLRYTTPAVLTIFDDIVLKGVFDQKGMPGFGDLLTPKDAELIKLYLISRIQETYDAQQAAQTNATKGEKQ
ncbi:MAG: PQQ-dependent dehydrogenase, methanol/ethanol family, partial [Coxiellaceae bacterium]|nr:PQQ-dependent dehydrogenase, methanol/ethanol family [Coxiellaceae bacterium]